MDPTLTIERCRPVRVLVVSEDAKERMRASSALLLHAGADVTEAATGAETKRLVREQEFDVLVVDGDLYPQGGFSLLYEIREAAEFEGTVAPPALVMISREQDRWLAGWAGSNEVLIKPVDPFVLADRVGALHGVEPAGRGVDESGEHVDAIVEDEGTAGLTAG
jgi:DNA-binding response OmpR family regulator